MFSLLAPFALWLAPLAAVPLVLALTGRVQPKTRDFPSLLPVRASLQQAMKRHRLKNWLQIILRTLIILCLLLAAAGLQWRGRHDGRTLPVPRTSGMLWQNGVYALTPASGGAPVLTGHRLAALRAALDSLAQVHGGRMIVEPVVPPGMPGEGAHETPDKTPEGGRSGGTVTGRGMPAPRQAEFPVVARFGAPAEAAARLLHTLDAGGGGGETHVFVPVFAARDLVALAPAARPWLEANPSARLVLLDYGGAAARLRTFAGDTALTTRTGPEARGQEGMMTLRVAAANPWGFSRAPVWRPARNVTAGTESVRDLRVEPSRHEASLTLRLPGPADGARWVAGTVAWPSAGPAHPEAAVTEHPVAYRLPPPATLCHVGSREAFVSLASLGEGGERLRVRALEATEAGPAAPSVASCHLLYLADPPALSPALLAQAASVLRGGGTVVLETGRHTDAALWNRHLLAPLEVGRLTVVVPETAAVRAVPAGLNAVGLRTERWGRPGTVTTRFGFQAHSGTHILLRADRATEPSRASGPVAASPPASPTTAREAPAVLVQRRVGPGRLWLWTTSLSDPGWSDLGLGPWPALIHQGLYDDTWAAGIRSHHADSDSLVWWPATADAPRTAPRVSDPDGNPFRRVRADAGGWWIGPFDQTGLYRITEDGPHADDPASAVVSPSRSGWLAVRLATPPRPPGASDWEAFRDALGADAWDRVVRLEEDDDWRTLYEGVDLRLALLGLAALLLFAEGVLSLRLAHDSRR